MIDARLREAIRQLARVTAGLPEAVLERDLQAGDGHWRDYPGTRTALLRVYLELRELAVLVLAARGKAGQPRTSAQMILGQHHAGYMDLLGTLSGAPGADIDREPAPGEWPLRTVLQHIIHAEEGFLLVCDIALARLRGEDKPWPERDPADVSGTQADILARYDQLHTRVLSTLATMPDADLDAPSEFWEGYDLDLRFRLLRFDAHLREHTIQVDKTLLGIDRTPNEPARLVRLLYNALGEAEGAAIGAQRIVVAEWERVERSVAEVTGRLRGAV